MAFPTVRLQCPRCAGVFDYEMVPGASFSAVRIGRGRYMRCPLCHQFAVFDLKGGSAPVGQPLGPTPAFTDRRHLLRWLTLFLVPAVIAVTALALLLPRPEPAAEASLAGTTVIVVVSLVLIYASSIPPRPPAAHP